MSTAAAASSTANTASNLVVLPEGATVSAGAIVWWRLSGVLDLALLTEAWEDADLPADRLPAAPSPKVALSRTLNELKSARRLVRSLSDGTAVVLDEAEVDGKLVHTENFRVCLNQVGQLVFDFSQGTGNEESADPVKARFDAVLTQIAQADVSPWLCRTMEWLDAVPLRDTGGVYFVPSFVKESWSHVVGALRVASAHSILSVPAMHTEEAASAFLDAARAEAEAEYETVMAELASGKLGKRALRTRIDASNRVESKLSRYEGLLGGKLNEMHDRLEELRASLSVALLTEVSDDAAS